MGLPNRVEEEIGSNHCVNLTVTPTAGNREHSAFDFSRRLRLPLNFAPLGRTPGILLSPSVSLFPSVSRLALVIERGALYNDGMIRSFHDQETEKVFNLQFSHRLPQSTQQVALRKLRMVNNSRSLNDLRIPPANRLEKLNGNREGQYSIRINDQWRICFEWIDNNAHHVEIVDYH